VQRLERRVEGLDHARAVGGAALGQLGPSAAAAAAPSPAKAPAPKATPARPAPARPAPPAFDAREICRRLRAHAGSRRTPVALLLANLNTPEDFARVQ